MNLEQEHKSLGPIRKLTDNSFPKTINKLDLQQCMTYLPSSIWAFWKDFKSVYRGYNNTVSSLFGNINGLKAANLKFLNRFFLQSDAAREIEESDQKYLIVR